MKYLILISLSLLIVNIGHTQSWQIVKSPTKQNFARLDMLSDTEGWAVTYDGLILKFTGKDWIVSDSLKITINDSTSIESSEIGDIYTIRMIDSENGWIAVNNAYSRIYSLFRYKNKNWNLWPITFPVKFRALDFISNNEGIAVGENGGFSFFEGKWNLIHLPVNTDLRAASYISSDKIIACGEKGTIIQKIDQWEVLDSPTNYLLRDIKFVSENEGWFVGKNGTILHYNSGKITKIKSPTKVNLWAVDFFSEDLGYAVGEQGVILKYDGINWTNITTPTNADLHDIELIDEKNGWIVGAWGTILCISESQSELTGIQHKFLFTDQVHLGSNNLIDRIDDVWGVSVADFNNDNLEDIYFTCYRSLNHLLLNQGDGYYLDYTIESGAGGTIESRLGKQKYEFGSLIADYDRDGDSDILLIGLYNTTRFLLNKGHAQFIDITDDANLHNDLNIHTGGLGDFNEDGYVDLALIDEKKGLRIFYNEKYNSFSEQNIENSFQVTGLRSINITDINYDQHSDLILFGVQEPTVLLNDGSGNWIKEKNVKFSYIEPHIVNSTSVSDFNNDGHQDIFICTENGRDALLINQYPELNFIDESEKWKIKKGGRSYSAIPADYDNDGDIDVYISRYGNDYLYLNEDCNYFEEVASNTVYSKSGFLSGFNIGASALDIENDGDLDIAVGNRNYWSSLLQNNQNDSAFIKIKIEGLYDTQEAFGAKIWVFSTDSVNNDNNLLAYREVFPFCGQSSQSSNIIHVGLGKEKNANIKIKYLNGDELYFNNINKGSIIQANQSNILTKSVYKVARTLMQYLHVPLVPFEASKLIIFIIVILISVRIIEKRYDWKHSHTAVYIVGAILVYSGLTFPFLDNSDYFIHFVPFLVFGAAILLLVTINENIRKKTLREKKVQFKLQESGTQLSKNVDINSAIHIAIKTIRFLYPYKYLVVYLYYPFGNYLSCYKNENIKINDADRIITLSRKSVAKVFKFKSPFSLKNLKILFPDTEIFKKDSTVFPLIRKQEFQGLIILGKENEQESIGDDILNNLKYLMMQLAIALNNLQILDKINTQQQLYAIGTYSSSILHNLKNPVDGLRMITEVLLNETKENSKNREYIEELYEGILKLKKDLINSFDFNKETLNTKNEIEVNSMLKDIEQNFKKTGYPNIQLEIKEDLGVISGNSEQIKQALENLIENAMEASNYSQPVKISGSKKNSNIYIDVKDYGKGISADKINKLFNMFYSTKGEGRGLGLSITRNIIERHNGFLELKTNKNEGTVFSIILPINLE